MPLPADINGQRIGRRGNRFSADVAHGDRAAERGRKGPARYLTHGLLADQNSRPLAGNPAAVEFQTDPFRLAGVRLETGNGSIELR